MRELWWFERLVADSARFAPGETAEGGCLQIVIPDVPTIVPLANKQGGFRRPTVQSIEHFLLTMRATGAHDLMVHCYGSRAPTLCFAVRLHQTCCLRRWGWNWLMANCEVLGEVVEN